MTLKGFRDMLLTVGVPVYHFEGFEETGPFIRWGEYNTGGYRADSRRPVTATSIQVDLFSQTEYDPLADRLVELFEANGVIYDGPLIARESDDNQKYFHYIYDCEVITRG